MGILEPGFICPTDGLDYIQTPGYFGHLNLARPVYYIQYLETIKKILRCICIKCSKLKIDKEKHKHALKMSPKDRWNYVFKIAQKVRRCGEDHQHGCGTKAPKKIYKQEPIADILIKSPKKLKSINCPPELNSKAIDEFLIIFLIAAKAKGISYFKNLDELNKKESPRLKWGSKILRMMGIKVITTKNSIKIFGNPKLEINKKIVIQKYLKDHRVFMTSVIAALSFGGEWHIHDKDSIQTSFPSFLKIINTFIK